MWTDTNEGRQLVGEISKTIVAQIAPEELEVFDEVLLAHFQAPEVARGKDDPLGFGNELIVALTPIVAMVVTATIKFVSEEVVKSVKEESAALVVQKVKALFNPTGEKKDDLPGLTPAQLETLKELIRKEALRGGLKPKKAEDLALIISARLALAK